MMNRCYCLRTFLFFWVAVGHLCHSLGDDLGNTTTNTTNTTASPTSAVVAGPHYRAIYKGRFQLLADGCTSDPPRLRATCGGTITLLITSHPTIVCDSEGTHQLTCYSTCAVDDSACQQDTYFNDGTYLTSEGPWGEIVYQCEGNTLEEVDTRFVFEAGKDGVCTWRWFFDNEVYHLAQLGVLCNSHAEKPIEDDTTVVSRVSYSSNDFEFEDSYLECSRGDSLAIDFEGPDHHGVFCAVGKNCGGDDCTVPFRNVTVHADVEKFAWKCVESLTAIVPTDGLAAIEEEEEEEEELAKEGEMDELEEGDYTIQFQAGWSILMKDPEYWYDNGDIEYFRYYDSRVLFTCNNGILQLTGSSSDLIRCFPPEKEDTLDCVLPVVSLEHEVNLFYYVTYNCTATNELPTTNTSFQGNFMTVVEELTDDLVVGHALQIGHYCSDDAGGGGYRYEDYYYECGYDDQYLLLDGNTDALGDRMTCLTTAPIAAKSDLAHLPRITMATDWRTDDGGLDAACYSFQKFDSPESDDTPMPTSNTTNSTDPLSR